MAKVIVGMSGGVDSAVCAYLLKASGYDVIGVTLKTWVAADGKESRCCEIDDARLVADQIGIPYYAVNCITEFHNCVIAPFIDAYVNGLTPNPCIVCNGISNGLGCWNLQSPCRQIISPQDIMHPWSVWTTADTVYRRQTIPQKTRPICSTSLPRNSWHIR